MVGVLPEKGLTAEIDISFLKVLLKKNSHTILAIYIPQKSQIYFLQ